MKKVISVLIAALPLSVHAADWINCGTDYQGDDVNCQYKIENKTLTIRGVGNQGNIGWWQSGNSYRAPWYGQSVTNVVIEDSIKNLGYQGFAGVQSNNPIVIPSGIKTISQDAFKYVNVPEVIIPDTVTSIGGYAFCYSSIEKINIPDSVKSIADHAFLGAEKLTDIVIPDSVQKIWPGAFTNCRNLQTLTIGENTVLDDIFGDYGGSSSNTNLSNLKIYCTGDTKKCDDNLAAAGYSDLKSIAATSKKINDKTYVLDKNGNIVATSGERANKRIYTIEEANLVSKPTKNRVSIRYR